MGVTGLLLDLEGLTYHAERIRSGAPTLSQVADDFARSAEFRAAIAGKSNDQIVHFIYQNTLNRAAGTGGKEFDTSQLDSGLTTADGCSTWRSVRNTTISSLNRLCVLTLAVGSVNKAASLCGFIKFRYHQ